MANGITTSDGSGDIIGFNDFYLGSSVDELESTDWTSRTHKNSVTYKKMVSVETSGGVLAAELHLMFRNKKLTNIFLDGKDKKLGPAIYNRLRQEYGNRFPSDKLQDLDAGDRLVDNNGNLLVLQEKDDGTPRLTIQ